MSRLRLLASLTKSARLIIFTAACIMVVGAAVSGIGRDIDNQLREIRYQYLPKTPSGQLVLVTIDTPSIQTLGSWPWPRGRHGALITALNRAGAKRIALDIVFDQPSADPRQDELFAHALAQSKAKVYLAAVQENLNNGSMTHEALPTKAFRPYVTPVSIWVKGDSDQVYRRMPVNVPFLGRTLPSLAQILANTDYRGHQSFLIDWSYDFNKFPQIGYADVLAGRFPKDFFKGKTVLVGADSFIMGDRYNVPYYHLISGMYIQAEASETLRAGLPAPLGNWPAAGLALLLIVATLWLKPARRYPALVASAMLLIAAQMYLEHVFAILLGVGAALTGFMAAILFQAVLDQCRAMLEKITRSADAGLPNLAAMGLHEIGEGVTIVVTLRNYVETTALLGYAAQGRLLSKIRDRLILAAGHNRIYQIDNHSFAWRSREDVPDVVASLEGLEALFAPGIHIEQVTVDITINAGFCDDVSLSIDEAMPKAIMAASQAVSRGILWERYENEDDQAFWKLSILTEFEQALDHGDVWVAYQPKYDLHQQAIYGAEALIRWTHPERGFIRPDKFIPTIEEAGRIERLTLYVLERAIADFAPLNLSIAVNISMRLLGKNRLEAPIRRLLKDYDMPAERLTLEITESASMADGTGIAELETLRAMGMNISIDDYGTGQSTLSYLKRLPATELKIDQSFVRQVLTSRSDTVLINSTIQLAHELDMKVVAEGVEEKDILDALAAMECDIIQGYYIGRPVALSDFTDQHLRKTDIPRSDAA